MTAVLAACGAAVAVSAVLTLLRLVRGPTSGDRLVAFDLMTVVVVAAVALVAARRGEAPSVVLVVIALVGFLATTSVVRLLAKEKR